ncbi:class I SAM-dependent methyltransferase [Priestia flexa]|uniref:class I SAM-dependent methyltransferase n=1 Tax=Priestia flexa TaxID=86664 RepID=UPI0032EE91A8
MGREFLNIFEKWAENYDSTVEGHDQEYQEVFRNYEEILQAVANRSSGNVIEFGVGTGNLTKKLLENNLTVTGIEPSNSMRKLAAGKLGELATLSDGDFLAFPAPKEQVDTIVSTYAFHHLTDKEKELAIRNYSNLLQTDGKIVFADTMFETNEAFQETIEYAKQHKFFNLAEDLQREYYTTIPVLKNLFEQNGFEATFERFNHFVWIVKATKQ